jgi:hypothetical protein
MINLKRILKRLPKYDDPSPAAAPYEQGVVLELIKHALATGRYDFTSRRSIRIWNLDYVTPTELNITSIEVEWKLND